MWKQNKLCFLLIITVSLFTAAISKQCGRNIANSYIKQQNTLSNSSSRVFAFENSDRIVCHTIEEELNGMTFRFDNNFLREITQIHKDDLETTFKQNVTNELRKHNSKGITEYNSSELKKYVVKKGKTIAYELHQIKVNVRIPDLNTNDYANYTSIFVVSVNNNSLVQTQCVVQRDDKEIALKDACKEEIRQKHGIYLNASDIIFSN